MCKIYVSCQLFFFPIFSSTVSFSCLLHWLGPKIKVEWKWSSYPFSRQQRDITTLQVRLPLQIHMLVLYVFVFSVFYAFTVHLLLFLAVLCLLQHAALSSCVDFSLWWLLLCTGSGCAGFGRCGTGLSGVVHGLGCLVACGIFPDQRSNLCSLHWQVDS